MKKTTKLTIILLISLVSSSIYAQRHEYETIFKKDGGYELPNIRFYGIINSGYSASKINDKKYNFLNIGGDAGVILNKRIGVGLFYQTAGEVSPFDIQTAKDINYLTSANFYGLSLTATPNPQKAVHLFGNLKLGIADAAGVIPAANGAKQNYKLDYNGGFMVYPTVGAEFNLFPWVSANLGLGYRHISKEKDPNLDFNKNFRALNFVFGIKIANIK